LILRVVNDFHAADYAQLIRPTSSSNHAIYDVNTIANYDPEIIPFLNAPIGSAFERDSDGKIVEIYE